MMTLIVLHVVYFYRSRLMANMEDQIFYAITEGQEMITVPQFISVSAGFKRPRKILPLQC